MSGELYWGYTNPDPRASSLGILLPDLEPLEEMFTIKNRKRAKDFHKIFALQNYGAKQLPKLFA